MPGPVQSVERAAAILKLLADGQHPLGLAEIAASLELAKGTAHGLLRTLQQVGFVEQDRESGTYHLGAELLHLGASYLDGNELRSHAINWADTLAARSGEAVRVGSLVRDGVLVVHHVFRPDNTPQTVEAGVVLPAHATALGKALLAYTVDLAQRTRAAPLQPCTRRTITEPRALARHLVEVRERGWAWEVGEHAYAVAGVAAPVRDCGGLVVGSVGVTGDQERVCDGAGSPRAAVVELVQDAAAAVSREVAARRW